MRSVSLLMIGNTGYYFICESILGSIHPDVFLKETQTGLSVYFLHIITQLVSPSEYLVELIVAESYHLVVRYGATIIYLADIGPHTCTQTHVTWFASGIEFTSREVKSAEPLTCPANGIHLAVAGGVQTGKYAIMS